MSGEPYLSAEHGEWVIAIYDDQPIPEGKTTAPEMTVLLTKAGQPWRKFACPSYPIWTLLAHWTDDLDVLAEAGPDPALATPDPSSTTPAAQDMFSAGPDGAHRQYVEDNEADWLTPEEQERVYAAIYYPGELIIADAAEYIAEHGHEYDAIHTSPPCQYYTRGNAKDRAAGTSKWPRSIPEIREALTIAGVPYVIENVSDAAWDMVDPIALCGCMFNLSTIDTDGIRIHLKRERLFETNWGLTQPRACNHDGIEWFAGAYGGARRDKYEAKYVRKGGYVPLDKNVVKALLGVEHEMTWNGLFECLPPAYTEHVGTQLLTQIGAAA